ncbi:P-loop containing nucleoside triphosphate hydrolase protein [Thozetella sp. PMI_491]|nr:P-loop containing nucleoside triphosphate hydrolase protein [Thozetella sp. PMI_491]
MSSTASILFSATYLICLVASTSSQISGVLQKVTFTDVNVYLATGQKRAVTAKDLPPLPASTRPEKVYDVLERGYVATDNLPGFWSYLYRVCFSEAAISFSCEIIDIICKFGQPWALRFFLATRQPHYIAFLFVLGLVDTIAVSQALFRVKLAGAKYRAGLASLIFRRALIPGSTRPTASSATNLVEVDVLRTQDFVIFIHAVWSAPLQVGIALVSIGVTLSWQSALASLGAVIALLPIHYTCNIILQRSQAAYMNRRDARMALASEAITNAKMIKVHAQEPYREERLDSSRRVELQSFELITWASALMNFVMRATPTLVAVVSFVTAVMVNGDLRGEQIFPALLFCSLLIGPLGLLPVVLSGWASCSVSYNRVLEFCTLDDNNHTTYFPDHMEADQIAITSSVAAQKVSYAWDKTLLPLLCDVTFSVAKGECVVIRGPVSGGKTTLLKLLLGSVRPDAGTTAIRGPIAYMPQDPWLISGTIRDNILLGRPFDEDLYHRVLSACALEHDLSMMELGDLQPVGSHGTGLSGGQKSRITLARVVYSRANTYIMDDPLAALDSRVVAHLMNTVFGPDGLLKDAARVIVSNSGALRTRADRAYILADGQLTQQAVPLVQVLTPDDSTTLETVENGPPTAGTRTHEADSFSTVRRQQNNNSTASQGTEQTSTPTELVPAGLYRRWFNIAGPWRWTLMTFISLLANLSSIGSTYILKELADALATKSMMGRLIAFAAAGVSQSLLMAISLLMGWYLCLKITSQRLHRVLVAGVLRSPLQFFRTTSSGEILNRFANDLTRHDAPLFGALFGFIQHILRAAVCLIVFTVALPWSIVVNMVVVLICLWLLRRCIGILAESRRLETQCRSPLITNLQETLDGGDQISTFGCGSYFTQRNFRHLEKNLQAYLAATKVELWLFFRLYLISAILQALAASSLFATGSSSSLIGFVMSYMLQLSVSMAGAVVTRAQIESEMICVQRIFSMADSEPERQYQGREPSPPIPASWPHTGKLTFRQYSAGYGGDEQTLALRDINLEFLPGQSTAIVGRSGAGKSSLALATLRLIEATHGLIEIDGLDISRVSLSMLRSRVAMIPQECRTFKGTVRENLDPMGRFDDSDILTAIQDSGLAKTFASPGDALNYQISQSGANLSAGQLQLLAIGRCLLQDAKVVVLDEATAAMDTESEKIVHEVLSTRFRHKTAIFITHRLQNALDCDRVVVVDSGKVVEVGSPLELFGNNGIFTGLVVKAGLQGNFKETKRR